MTERDNLRLVLEEAEEMTLFFWGTDDIVAVHLGEMRPVVMDDADPTLMLRMNDEDDDAEHVLGVETLAFERGVLGRGTFLASAWEPAREEIEEHTGHTPSEDFVLTVARTNLPKTHSFLLLLIGWAAAKHDSLWNPTQPDEWPELIYVRDPEAEAVSR